MLMAELDVGLVNTVRRLLLLVGPRRMLKAFHDFLTYSICCCTAKKDDELTKIKNDNMCKKRPSKKHGHMDDANT